MRIPELKPFSADFDSEANAAEPEVHACDIPGCRGMGEFKAPKSRALDEYYTFCAGHIAEYNKNWNYFEGMTQQDIEQHIYNQMTWDRPTWASNLGPINVDGLKSRVYEGLRMDGFTMGGGFKGDKDSANGDEGYARPAMPSAEVDALATLGLEPPINWQDIRDQYKALVKKHHPDIAGDGNEDAMKKINMAYSILKIAYQKYEKLEKR